ncbi:MAG: 50S ribosomal protein L22 [Candidatus Paceibacterota bacterium]|jgi:large subunit ribosomal protein L22
MEVKASLKYLKISPRKTRLVIGLLKGLSVQEAEAQLTYNKKRGSEPIMKLLKSVVSNAENNFHLNKDNLFIKLIRVDEGPALKRHRPRARGAVYTIKKRTSHINIILDEIIPSKHEEKKSTVKMKSEDKNILSKEAKVKKTFQTQEKEKIVKKVLPKQKIFRRKVI